jgi:hypothetical protein
MRSTGRFKRKYKRLWARAKRAKDLKSRVRESKKSAKWREENRERSREYSRLWRTENRGRVKSYNARYHLKFRAKRCPVCERRFQSGPAQKVVYRGKSIRICHRCLRFMKCRTGRA